MGRKHFHIYKELTTVTPFSIFIAGLLCIFVILSAFIIFTRLQSKKELTTIETPNPTSSVSQEGNGIEPIPDDMEEHVIKELGISLAIPKGFTFSFEKQMNLDTNEPYAYSFTVQNYTNGPTDKKNYQLYALYQFDTDKVEETVFQDLKNELETESITEASIISYPFISGKIKGERSRWATYILKDGYILKLLTSEPTEENKLITEKILRTLRKI